MVKFVVNFFELLVNKVFKLVSDKWIDWLKLLIFELTQFQIDFLDRYSFHFSLASLVDASMSYCKVNISGMLGLQYGDIDNLGIVASFALQIIRQQFMRHLACPKQNFNWFEVLKEDINLLFSTAPWTPHFCETISRCIPASIFQVLLFLKLF